MGYSERSKLLMKNNENLLNFISSFQNLINFNYKVDDKKCHFPIFDFNLEIQNKDQEEDFYLSKNHQNDIFLAQKSTNFTKNIGNFTKDFENTNFLYENSKKSYANFSCLVINNFKNFESDIRIYDLVEEEEEDE